MERGMVLTMFLSTKEVGFFHFPVDRAIFANFRGSATSPSPF